MKKKTKKVYQPVVHCTVSQVLFVDPVKARKHLMKMIDEVALAGGRHYFDVWLEGAEVGDTVGFSSGTESGLHTLHAYIDVLEVEE